MSNRQEESTNNNIGGGQPKSNGFKIETKRNREQGEQVQPNVSFSFTSSSHYSESSPSKNSKAMKKKDSINNLNKDKSKTKIESNLTFLPNVQDISLLNESIKQLQFSYDDMEETMFKTNLKKNSLSESKEDQIAQMINNIRDKEESTIKERNKNNFKIERDKEIIKENTQVKKEQSKEKYRRNNSNIFSKSKTKQSHHKIALDNIIDDTSEENEYKLADKQEEEFNQFATNGNLIASRIRFRSSLKSFKDNKILVENSLGKFISNKLIVDTKGIEGGLRNKRDGYVFFGFDQNDAKGQIINDVIVNKKALNNVDEAYINYTLFLIFYDNTSQKFFFQSMKNKKAKQALKVYFNIITPFHFISNQTFEMNSNIVKLEPNCKDNTLAIKINQNNSITITKSKQVSFNNTLNGIEVKSLATASGDVSSICTLHYEKGKELWTLVPQSVNIWINLNCKQSFEQTGLIKYGNEAIIKITPIK